jgi:hypothetical protein
MASSAEMFCALELHDALLSGRAQRGEGAAVLLHEDAVAGAQSDIGVARAEDVLVPDRPRMPATQDRDLGNLGFNRHAAGGGQHARQRRRRPLDRVDALRRHGARDRHGRAVTGLAADDDLRVGRLFVEVARDHLAQLFGRVAGGANAAGIGDEDEPALSTCTLSMPRRIAAFAGEQPVAHVLVDGQRQKIAGADHLGIGCAGVDERRGKAQDRCGRRHGGHARVDLDDEGVALVLDGTGEKLVAGGAGAGEERTGRCRRHDDTERCQTARTGDQRCHGVGSFVARNCLGVFFVMSKG